MRDELEELKRQYLKELPEKFKPLQLLTAISIEALKAGKKPSWSRLSELAHKLAGSSGTYGFPLIAEVASSLENLINQNKITHLSVDKTINFLTTWNLILEKSLSHYTKLKILLAEDDPSIQSIAETSLSKVGGHNVLMVNDGIETIKNLKNFNPDVILLDVMMPKLNGFETCKIIKQSTDHNNTPIIFLTAKAQAHEMKTGMSLGAIGYILKPFDPMTLAKQIQEIIKANEDSKKDSEALAA